MNNMTNNNRVYYGEYTLEYWVKLIKSGKIILPDYQRSFVWSPEKIKNLIKAIENGEFVPPIIIGAVRKDGSNTDMILDGQQRLTTILFASLGKYLDVMKYHKYIAKLTLGNERDDEEDDINKVADWTFKDLIADGKIGFNNSNEKYVIDLEILLREKRDDFLKNNYLGFCYIVPDANLDIALQSSYFSKIFRALNTGAELLTRLEARRSLYFLKENLDLFFDPKFIERFTISSAGKENKRLDFVKYLSICSHYEKTGDIKKFGSRVDSIEKFYERYIYEVVNASEESVDFNTTDNVDRIKKLYEAISIIKFPESFGTTIQADVYFFGLVYYIVFCNRDMIFKKGNKSKSVLDGYINDAKANSDHLRNPSRKSFLLERLKKSIEIYEKYLATNVEDIIATTTEEPAK